MKIIKEYITFINEDVQNIQPVQAQQIQQDVSQEIPETQKENDLTLNTNKVVADKINKIVDYTSIRPGLLKENIKQIVTDAVDNDYYGICVNPDFVDYVVYEIEENDIKVISTLDFPEGKMIINEKMTELIKIISDGADEIVLSIDIQEFKDAYADEDEDNKNETYNTIEKDIKKIADECHKSGVVLKVIIESGILSFDELKDICRILSDANIDFVQTSSGTKEIGAEIDKVKEIRRLLPDYIKICASGGIRTLEDANKFYPYVDRIATSIILK
jgi:deoxyribose-phosphate aldolase